MTRSVRGKKLDMNESEMTFAMVRVIEERQSLFERDDERGIERAE